MGELAVVRQALARVVSWGRLALVAEDRLGE